MVRKESLCVLDATPNLTKGISFTLITTHSLHYVYTHTQHRNRNCTAEGCSLSK